MIQLWLGVLLWSLAHLTPSVAPGLKRGTISRFGENAWKGLFSLTLLLAIALIVRGWKAAVPELLYLPPDWGRHATALLVLAGFVLFFAPYPPNNLRRVLRHPQLTGVALWGLGHLLANGETRSVVLFGTLTAWALLEIVFINRRDGARTAPPVAPRRNDVLLVLGALVAYAVMAGAHAWLFGVSPFIY